VRKYGRADWIRSLLTYLLNYLAHRDDRFAMARGEFRKLSVPPAPPKADHPHGQLATDRSVARNFASFYCRLIGLTPYVIQESPSEQKSESHGMRTYYWTKDTQALPHVDAVTPDDLLISIDVDYYLDMPNVLIKHGRPILLYTLIPERVASNSAEFSFTFNKDNEIVYRTTGGTTYKHRLWNYCDDVIQVHSSSLLSYLFHEYTSMAFQLEVKRVSPHHYLVLLYPFMAWRGIFGILHWALSGNSLEKLSVVEGDFTRLDIISNLTNPTHYRSTGAVNGYHCAHIPVHQDTRLAQMAANSANKLSQAQILSQIGDPTAPLADGMQDQVCALQAYHNAKIRSVPQHISVVTHSQALLRYQFKPARYDPNAKASLDVFMDPFVIGCYAPDRTKANEEEAVDKRITSIQTKVYPSHRLMMLMEEFLEFLIPVPHQLHPTDEDEVFERQSRPAQRAKLNHATYLLRMKRYISSFLKCEAYGEVKPPRLISTTNDFDKMQYSRYMYAFTEVLKRTEWYAFGKTPKEISERIAMLAASADTLDLGDISRMDGTISPALRVFERMALLRAFHRAYHPEIIELHQAQFDIPAVTTEGVRYYLHTARASGSAETSNLNSADNAFAAYCSYRMDKPGSPALTPAAAWAALGFYGGDDSCNKNSHPEKMVAAYKNLGLTLKSKVIERGQPGVEFLARQYSPFVWNGATDNCCSIQRQLSKFHTCVKAAASVANTVKLTEKALAFWLTDEHTPVIGPYVSKVLYLAGVNPLSATVDEMHMQFVPYWTLYDRTDQFPNVNTDGWMFEYLRKELPNLDYHKFIEWVDGLQTLEDALHPPLLQTDSGFRSFSEQVVINGEVHIPKPKDELPEAKVVVDLQPDAESYHPRSPEHALYDDDDAEPLDRTGDSDSDEEPPRRPVVQLGHHRRAARQLLNSRDPETGAPAPSLLVKVPPTEQSYYGNLVAKTHTRYLHNKANSRLAMLMAQLQHGVQITGPTDWIYQACLQEMSKEMPKTTQPKPRRSKLKEVKTLTLPVSPASALKVKDPEFQLVKNKRKKKKKVPKVDPKSIPASAKIVVPKKENSHIVHGAKSAKTAKAVRPKQPSKK
jgi:hypothetical protein